VAQADFAGSVDVPRVKPPFSHRTGSTRATVSTDTVAMNVKPSQFDMLASLVNASALRHRILSSNVANVNTPGYRRTDVSFEEELAKELKRSGQVNLKHLRPEVVADNESPSRVDGNNVDIDQEMGRISKNTLLHNTYLQIMASKSGAMRRAISRS